ncbi:hypothetical protein [Thalassoroseus pseudoceratinae]|uniref:hypothetical protein n=1 Tax=Thalassoroseus pseudoceratinae TaxID=2713176 RepID=UPI00141F63FE|nr:hypothetical protein [Thalassoroseus pseudoceratinae]
MRNGGPCPICRGVIERDGRQLVTKPDGTSRRAQVFHCSQCEFRGFAREFEREALFTIDDRYAFYFCPKPKLALFYREKVPQKDPIHEIDVDVPDLNGRRVTIKLMGLGKRGRERLLKIMGDSDCPIFPVDLWHDPGCIRPRRSRTVDQPLMNHWANVIERETNGPHDKASSD